MNSYYLIKVITGAHIHIEFTKLIKEKDTIVS